ncbi:MAG TPA: FAD-binding oxidoreductase, partial [Vicinamibacterales bacterium]|nr:FAD-binding oxidoreductase [Vicinamibacterales bacterium]
PTPTAAVKPALQPNATLLAREDVTDSMAAFTVALDEPFDKFRPGQYVSLGVVGEAGLIQRPYSIVSLDGDRDRVELFIRRVPDGALSSRLWRLPIGARVRVGQPKGLFVLDEADSRPRLFIGTGTGLAPLLAMLEAIMERGDGATSVLIHGVSYRDELAYGYRIASWMATGLPLVYRPTLSRPDDPRNAGWRGLTGRADTAIGRLLVEMPFLRGGVAYMCGNGSMVDICTKMLVDSGLAPQDVRAEQFHAPTAAPSAAPASTAVS